MPIINPESRVESLVVGPPVAPKLLRGLLSSSRGPYVYDDDEELCEFNSPMLTDGAVRRGAIGGNVTEADGAS